MESLPTPHSLSPVLFCFEYTNPSKGHPDIGVRLAYSQGPYLLTSKEVPRRPEGIHLEPGYSGCVTGSGDPVWISLPHLQITL